MSGPPMVRLDLTDPGHRPSPVVPGAGTLPYDMTGERRWVTWRWDWKGGKWTKKSPPRWSATSTWRPFADCLAEAAAGRADGVGFVLGQPTGRGEWAWQGLDYDKVADNPDLPMLRAIGAKLGYVETSPSGAGLHVICPAYTLPRGRPKHRLRHGGDVEHYGSGWFTVTGRDADRGSVFDPIAATVLADDLIQPFIEGGKARAAPLPKTDPADNPSGWWKLLPSERREPELRRLLDATLRDNDPAALNDQWRPVGMACWHASGGAEWAWEAFDAWALEVDRRAGQHRYDRDTNRRRWESFDPATYDGPPITIGTLIALAGDAYQRAGNGLDPDLADRLAKIAGRFAAPERDAPSWQEGASAAALMRARFRPPVWALPDLVPEGFSVFAGKQKSGKSWWCLSLAHAVGDKTEFLGETGSGGDVLLLALEDNPRRLQDRMRKMGLAGSPRVSIYTSWPTGQDGLAKVLDWIEAAKEPRLIVIDTVRRLTGPSPSRENAYERDVTLFSPLQKAAAAARVAIVGVTHMRKDTRRLDHWQDAITGSAGLPSVADAVLLLTRREDGGGALLRGTGRDLAEVELALHFDRGTCTWHTSGEAVELAVARIEGSEAERRLIETLERAQPATAAILAEHLGRSVQAVRATLSKLHGGGAVAKNDAPEPLWTLKRSCEKPAEDYSAGEKSEKSSEKSADDFCERCGGVVELADAELSGDQLLHRACLEAELLE